MALFVKNTKRKNDITYDSDLLLIYDSYEDIEKRKNDNLKKDFLKELKVIKFMNILFCFNLFLFYIYNVFILNNVQL